MGGGGRHAHVRAVSRALCRESMQSDPDAPPTAPSRDAPLHPPPRPQTILTMASRAVAGRMSWRRASTVRGLVVEGASRTGSRSSGMPCCSMRAACESPVPLALLPRYDRSMSNIAPAEWEDESRSCTCNCDCVDRVRRVCPSGGSARRHGGPHNPGIPCHLLRDCYASRRGHSAAYSTV